MINHSTLDYHVTNFNSFSHGQIKTLTLYSNHKPNTNQLPYMVLSRDQSSYLPITCQGSILTNVMWGYSKSAFNNTSIEHNINVREAFLKNLEIQMKSDLARSLNINKGSNNNILI